MTMTINCRCPLCGSTTQVTCEENAWQTYANGALAQDAFADMDLVTRETLISGMCEPCQIRFFETDDEENCDGECDTCEHYDCPLITNEDS